MWADHTVQSTPAPSVRDEQYLLLPQSPLVPAAPDPSMGPRDVRDPRTWCMCPHCRWPACDRLGARQGSRSLSHAHPASLPATRGTGVHSLACEHHVSYMHLTHIISTHVKELN